MYREHLRAVWEVARKELRTSFRDRQTTIYALVLPICMYPVVFWVIIQGVLVIQGKKERTEVEVGVVAEAPARITSGLKDALEARASRVRKAGGPGGPAEDPGSGDANEGAAVAGAEQSPIEVVHLITRDESMTKAQARAWIEGQVDPQVEPGQSTHDAAAAPTAEPPEAVLFLPTPAGTDESAERNRATLFFDSTKSRSETARKRVNARLNGLIQDLRDQGAREAGRDPRDLEPIVVERFDIAPKKDRGALALSLMLPMLLVFMSVMGAFFPAVDLTAGEKERKTAETTMLLPVPRTAIHQGKILAVTATAALATFLNLIAIGLSAEHLLASLTRATDLEIKLPVAALFSIIPLALCFTLFVSSALTGFAGLAASFKEGQALLGPVQMVFIMPAMAGALPGLELTPGTALIPVVNVVLAFRAMLLQQGLYLEYGLTFLSLILYAWLSVAFAVRLLSRESVLLAGQTISFKHLFSLLRSN